jgi:hypothetical protein
MTQMLALMSEAALHPDKSQPRVTKLRGRKNS